MAEPRSPITAPHLGLPPCREAPRAAARPPGLVLARQVPDMAEPPARRLPRDCADPEVPERLAEAPSPAAPVGPITAAVVRLTGGASGKLPAPRAAPFEDARVEDARAVDPTAPLLLVAMQLPRIAVANTVFLRSQANCLSLPPGTTAPVIPPVPAIPSPQTCPEETPS